VRSWDILSSLNGNQCVTGKKKAKQQAKIKARAAMAQRRAKGFT